MPVQLENTMGFLLGLAAVATHAGMLAIVAVLTSLYPGVTVLLARTVVHERISRSQRAGLSLCALAVIAIAA